MDRAPVILVLGGGDSPERDVSLQTARGVAKALRERGFGVLALDPAVPVNPPTDDIDGVFGDARIGETPPRPDDDAHAARAEFVRIVSAWEALGVDAVFVGLHGGAGEDGTVQAILDYVGVPYTGSPPEACALAMDKARARRLAVAAGVDVAPGVVLDARRWPQLAAAPSAGRASSGGGPDAGVPRRAEPDAAPGAGPAAPSPPTLVELVRRDVGDLPVVVKPNAQGSSVGLSIVRAWDDLGRAVGEAFAVDERVLVERYVAGREVTQAVVEGIDALPVLEVRPRSGVYDYRHKYQPGYTDYLVPAPIDADAARRVAEATRRVVDALGLEGYARIDFRLDPAGRAVLLEANTLPGMTATSLVPKACAAVGVDYGALCERIVRHALARAARRRGGDQA